MEESKQPLLAVLKIEITTKYSAEQLNKGIVSKILLTNPIKNKYTFDKAFSDVTYKFIFTQNIEQQFHELIFKSTKNQHK